jgi:hypothetical protein
MLQKPVTPREDDVLAAGYLLAERGLALIGSVLDQRELRRSAYDLLDSWEGPEPTDGRAAVGLIREQLVRLLEACAARCRQDEVQRILVQQFRCVEDRLHAPRAFDG